MFVQTQLHQRLQQSKEQLNYSARKTTEVNTTSSFVHYRVNKPLDVPSSPKVTPSRNFLPDPCPTWNNPNITVKNILANQVFTLSHLHPHICIQIRRVRVNASNRDIAFNTSANHAN